MKYGTSFVSTVRDPRHQVVQKKPCGVIIHSRFLFYFANNILGEQSSNYRVHGAKNELASSERRNLTPHVAGKAHLSERFESGDEQLSAGGEEGLGRRGSVL